MNVPTVPEPNVGFEPAVEVVASVTELILNPAAVVDVVVCELFV